MSNTVTFAAQQIMKNPNAKSLFLLNLLEVDDEESVSSDISADAMSDDKEPEKESETPEKPDEITEESPASTKTRAHSPTTSKVPEKKHPSTFPPFKKATKRAIVTTPEKQPKLTKVKPKPKDNVK